jgi:hypothetical protein
MPARSMAGKQVAPPGEGGAMNFLMSPPGSLLREEKQGASGDAESPGQL